MKAFAREDYEQERFEKESRESVERALEARSIKAKLAPIVEIIVACGTCLVLWYGARLVLTGGLTSGELLVFLMYLGKMYKPMRELSKMTDTISKADVGWERIREVLENEMQVRDLPRAKPAPRFKGRIEFDRVSFSYEPSQPVLQELSLMIEPGQLAALVGPTGAGKTTIVSLLPRFYDWTSGIIRIDGQDIRQFKIKSLRQQISFVLQEALLFRATVAQNIAYGKPEATEEEIIRAAKLAKSGLDSEAEQLVFEALSNLMAGKTSIVIAHRLATVRRADVIFVIDKGYVVERGTHEELLKGSGLYSRLYELQFRGEEESAKEVVTV